MDWQRYAYLRYEGQGYELKIDLPPGGIGADYAGRIMAAFHEAYQSTYGYSQADSKIEATDWHLTATIPTGLSSDDTASDDTDPSGANAVAAAAENGGGESGGTAKAATRKTYFQEFGDFIECQVIDRYALRPGDRFAGPAIVEERESTTIVLPGDTVEVRPARHLNITMGEAQ